MHEADDALQQAIEELRRAQLACSDDLAEELQEIIRQAEDVLDDLQKRQRD